MLLLFRIDILSLSILLFSALELTYVQFIILSYLCKVSDIINKQDEISMNIIG
jgi:hypothetical protein